MSAPVSALAHDMTMSSDDDAPTAVGLRSRVHDDFDRAFVDHYERLVRALTLIAGDRETAADAVQEAFVKAHLRWRRISRYDDPVGWIRRVAINQLRDQHRRDTRKRRALARLASRAATHTVDPDVDEFDRLLAALPRQQRAVTALFYVDGLTVAQIADALDIAEGSVKSHLHDARRRLRPLLSSDDPQNDRDQDTNR